MPFAPHEKILVTNDEWYAIQKNRKTNTLEVEYFDLPLEMLRGFTGLE